MHVADRGISINSGSRERSLMTSSCHFPAAEQGPCETGWVHNEGRCYRISSQSTYTYDESKSRCNRVYDAHLVSVATPEENDFIFDLLK